jgi:epoxyqueuosine reductase
LYNDFGINKMDEKSLNALLAISGAIGKLVPISRVADLEENIAALHENHLLADEFNLQEFAQFNFTPPAEIADAKSMLVLAYPHFPTLFHFQHKGSEKTFAVPPTYLKGRQADDYHIAAVADYCRKNGFHLERAIIPKKLSAVCSGLGEYGRNNIVYLKGLGSYARLAAYFSDLPCGEDKWHEVTAMARCTDCQACRKACPSGAIGEDRFLLHAERCLTWWNEKPTEVPFPGWIQPAWHNCLVGCLLCQRICPEDKPYINLINEGPSFNEAETEMMLQGLPMNDLPLLLQEKLTHSGLVDYYDPRNFRAILTR